MWPRLSAPRLIVLGFAGFILLGTLLLKLPMSSRDLSWLDAFFLSVSAVCVTGLSPVDIAPTLTPVGDGILAGLVQVGGLGIMTATTVGAILLGRRLGFGDLLKVREELGAADAPRNILRLLGQIALITVAIELVGFILLTVGFAFQGIGWIDALGYGVFHAITGFCNAGFTNLENGLYPYAGNWGLNLTLVYLIVAGGLGFPVLVNLYYYRRLRRLTLHSKLVLVASAALLVAGILSFAVLEWTNPRTLGGEPISTRAVESVFQGVTPRTAGFQTLDYADMRDSTLSVQIGLMFFGTAPISTGGGIKVTTMALMFLILLAHIRGQQEVTAFGRRISGGLIFQALALLSVVAFVLPASAVALMFLEDLGALPALFEIVSAFGTVGLSLNITPELGASGKLLVAFMMFFGRVGPITLLLAFRERARPRRYTYPEEDVALG
jgi:trk system potassium uptake protein TrkH